MGESSAGHVPVLVDTVVALLGPALEPDGAVLLDATLGRAGHARALLAAYPGMILIGVDADLTAIERSRELLSAYADRVTLVHAFYDEIPAVVAAAGLDSVQAVLFDLGVSSPQLDDPERGFAYSQDAPLDMRMDRTRELTAAEVVNSYPAGELARVLRDYGEERFARRIADAVVRERARSPITSTGRLQQHRPGRDTRRHPADRRSPRQAHLPGAADRGEPRAGHPRPRAARRPRPALGGRADRRPGLPLARRPRGEAGARRGRRRHHPARPAGAAARQRAAVPPADPGSAAAITRRTRREPTCGIGAAPGRDADPEGGVNGVNGVNGMKGRMTWRPE